MRLQADHKVRVVALSNLEAMCERISDMCHRFWIEKTTPNRVYVCYSNPNEYGSESPMVAVFPSYPIGFHDPGNQYVVLDILRVNFDNWDGDGWQAFSALLDCPELYRSSAESKDWATSDEILKAKA